jgi:long-chain fatty acid transport protein
MQERAGAGRADVRRPAAAVTRAARTFALLLALLACTAERAQASPLFELSGDASGSGGLAARASGPGAASAYFNPALLPAAEPGLSLGVFVLVERIDVDVDPRASAPLCAGSACDVPEVNGAGPESFRRADGSPLDAPTLPTAWLRSGRRAGDGEVLLAPRPRQAASTGRSEHAYAVLGLVHALAEGRAALGLHAMLPLGDFLRARAFYTDEREQFFSNSLHPERYGDRLTMFGLAFGAGVRLTDALSLGASLSLGIHSAARAPVYVSNLADLDTLLLDSDVGVALSLAPHVGLAFAPAPFLRLTATAHSPQAVDVETGFRYVIATGIEQRAAQSFTHGYLPWTFALGAELELLRGARQRVALVALGSYALWSNYRDRHGERARGAYAWSDVPSATLGVRHELTAFRSFLDLRFEPSPVPDQTGRSNQVDGHLGSASLGTSYGFLLLGARARLGVQLQAHHMLPRSVRKLEGEGEHLVRDEVPDDAVGGTPRGPIPGREGLQTNNPGFPGFASQGWLFGGGASLSLYY